MLIGTRRRYSDTIKVFSVSKRIYILPSNSDNLQAVSSLPRTSSINSTSTAKRP
jgi:hypothetical protein